MNWAKLEARGDLVLSLWRCAQATVWGGIPTRSKITILLTLASRLKCDDLVKIFHTATIASDSPWKVIIRDRLLMKETAVNEANLIFAFKVNFPEPQKVNYFQLTGTPGEGYYQGRTFSLEIEVPLSQIYFILFCYI
uniref:UBC core domain-containing protein n=1 Tax=Vombatus ursinus TaxID=29139 RepID=A0A4X2KL32_VOMUR